MLAAVQLSIVLLLITSVPPSKNFLVVELKKPQATILIIAGRSGEAHIKAIVKSGFHVQANPSSETYLIPTKLEFNKNDDVEIVKIFYPKGKPYRIQGAEKDLVTYDGTIEIKVSLKAAARPKRNDVMLQGSMRYQ